MQLKLDLVQEQLSGAKFGQIAGRGPSGVGSTKHVILKKNNSLNKFIVDDSSDDAPAMPYLRKAISEYDPELVRQEESEMKKKRLELEKNEKDVEFFTDFTDEEVKELDKLDNLTKLYLFLRRYITNPIISCDEIDIKYAVKDFSAGSLHCQNRIERIAKKKIKTPREQKVLKGLTETKTMIFNIFSTLIYSIVSYTSSIAYMFMFLNCMCTGNLMSMFYPLSVLLYALLEDPRPKSRYWSIILIYAECVILFKFLIQQNALTVLTPGSLFVEIVDKYKLGFRVFDKKEYAHGIFDFIIWDILVALSVLLHQHCLVLVGLWKKRENDIETLDDAQRRIQIHIQRKKYENKLEEIKRNESIRRLTNSNNPNNSTSSDDSSEHLEVPTMVKIKTDNPAELGKSLSAEYPKKAPFGRLKRGESLRLPSSPVKIESTVNASPSFSRKKTVVLNKNTLDLESVEDEFEDLNKVVYGADYFIHDYSEDTQGGKVHSCEARI